MCKPQAAGGIVTGQINRAKALATYMAAPNYCGACNSVIAVGEGQKVATIRLKKFCSRSCAAKKNNSIPKRKRTPRLCDSCGERHVQTRPRPNGGVNYNRLCEVCHAAKYGRLDDATKAEASHSQIRAHARQTARDAGMTRRCVAPGCDYVNFAECCHIRPVADFPPSAKLREINHPDNLVMLCLNHHWDLDHGLLSLTDMSKP